MVGVLQFLAGMEPPLHGDGKGIDQLAQIEHLHQGGFAAGHRSRPGRTVLVEGEEHRLRLCVSCDSSPQDGQRG